MLLAPTPVWLYWWCVLVRDGSCSCALLLFICVVFRGLSLISVPDMVQTVYTFYKRGFPVSAENFAYFVSDCLFTFAI